MNDLRTAAQQALEALKSVQDHRPNDETNNAITAFRAALAEPCRYADQCNEEGWCTNGCEDRAALAEPVQEPAYKVKVTGRWHDTEPLAHAFSLPDGEHLLYTAPPQRPAKPVE